VIYSIVGMQFRNAEWLHREPPRDPSVTLIREPENPYDANAIQVWIDGAHVGYIPAKSNAALAASMDKSGKNVTGTFIRQIDGWPGVEID
jgi:hypothetical protein